LVQSRHSLLVALVITTAAVTVALSWAAWRLIHQQRDIDEQRAQEQLGAAAESMAARIRGKLAETGERLSQAAVNPSAPLAVIDGGGILIVRPDGVVNAAGLPFVPSVPNTSAIDALFDEAEMFELAREDLSGAATRYQNLARHDDATVRAGALVRLARVAEKRGDTDAALRAYKQLEHSGDVRFQHLPARFVALYQRHAIAKARADAERERSLHATLTQGLDAGGWLLTRDAATWYREQLEMLELPRAWPLADAVDRVARMGQPLSPRGQRVFTDTPGSILVMWRTNGPATAMTAVFLDRFLPSSVANVAWHLADPSGRWLAGERAVPRGAAAPRVVGDSEYAWVLHVGGPVPAGKAGTGDRTVIAMTTAMLMFLWGAMYFMARAIRREAAVARLQSDFVAAVSHEFRTPLTTIRQMAEMLEAGRVTSSDRQQAYYGVLSAEASRLQRLVETLLNFGRMEAGAARYKLENLDLADVVRRVVQEMEPMARDAGKRIVASGPDSTVVVQADANSLALAVRNLIDNALKYSPHDPEVRVEWEHADGRALIRIIDRGLGIPRLEHQAVFEKFVRGRSAVDGNVAGTGVGLAMVRQILRAHNGDVDIESEVGEGSTFTVTLPLADAGRPIPDPHRAVVHW